MPGCALHRHQEIMNQLVELRHEDRALGQRCFPRFHKPLCCGEYFEEQGACAD